MSLPSVPHICMILFHTVNKKASKSCINDTQGHMINVQYFLFDKGIH